MFKILELYIIQNLKGTRVDKINNFLTQPCLTSTQFFPLEVTNIIRVFFQSYFIHIQAKTYCKNFSYFTQMWIILNKLFRWLWYRQREDDQSPFLERMLPLPEQRISHWQCGTVFPELQCVLELPTGLDKAQSVPLYCENHQCKAIFTKFYTHSLS